MRYRHGTRTCYVLDKCRCEDCRAANREYGAKYTVRERERVRALARQSHQRNKAQRNAQRRERYATDPEGKKASNRRSAAKFRERTRTQGRAYYLANREAIRAKHRAWAASPEGRLSLAARNCARRARVQAAAGQAAAQQIADRIAFYGGRCWMCGDPATTVDHVIPLFRGGTNWPANLRPACKACNSRKGHR